MIGIKQSPDFFIHLAERGHEAVPEQSLLGVGLVFVAGAASGAKIAEVTGVGLALDRGQHFGGFRAGFGIPGGTEKEQAAGFHRLETNKSVKERVGVLALDGVEAALGRAFPGGVALHQRSQLPASWQGIRRQCEFGFIGMPAIPAEAKPLELRLEVVLQHYPQARDPGFDVLLVTVGQDGIGHEGAVAHLTWMVNPSWMRAFNSFAISSSAASTSAPVANWSPARAAAAFQV